MTAAPQPDVMQQPKPNGGGGVVTVQRPDTRRQVGQGMLKGMLVVLRHFGKSFVKYGDSKDDNTGMFTVEYPEERMALPEAFRNMPVLLYDDKTGHELCTSCFQCERICPPKVIHITQATDPKTGKPVPAAEEFILEYDSCMSCGYCAEICPFDAIKMDHFYELSTADHLSMDVDKATLNRPISYYQAIAPSLWAEVEAQAMKKLQNNIKRRPGTIGVAPHMVGKQLAAAPSAGAATPAAGAAARPAAPVAAIGKNMPADKVERLKAIRAANAAKRGGVPGAAAGAPSAEALAGQTLPEQGTHMADSQADVGGVPQAGAGPVGQPGDSGPVAEVGQNMSEEKRARLEAIRAAKRAQRENQ